MITAWDAFNDGRDPEGHLPRFAALERLTVYLLAQRLRDKPIDEAPTLQRCVSGHQLRAADGISDEAIDDISIMADEHVERIVARAIETEEGWRTASNS